jgi:glycogen operon protein
MGDERGRTQFGNNNVWCQDNERGWLDWSFPEGEEGQFRQAILTFVRRMLTLRAECGAFGLDRWLEPEDDSQLAVRWRSFDGGEPDWHGGDDRRLVLEWVPKGMPALTVSFDAAEGSIIVPAIKTTDYR